MSSCNIDTETKWQPFSRRHFLNDFSWNNVSILIKLWLKFVPYGRMGNTPSLVLKMFFTKHATNRYLNQRWRCLMAHICVTKQVEKVTDEMWFYYKKDITIMAVIWPLLLLINVDWCIEYSWDRATHFRGWQWNKHTLHEQLRLWWHYYNHNMFVT